MSSVSSFLPFINSQDITRVSIYGKARKIIKVVCISEIVKKDILKQVKISKPKDIFISEFLTSIRNKLFYELRQLKKSYHTKVFAVYTRDGNLFYKLSSEPNKFNIIRTSVDIMNLKDLLQSD